MLSNNGLNRFAVNKSGILENLGKNQGDSLEPMTDALKELRAETLRTSQVIFTQDGGNRPVKIRQRSNSLASYTTGIQGTYSVTGYFTLLKYLTNRTPQVMETMLGFAPGSLAGGADILVIIDQLAGYQTAPRYASTYSGGASRGAMDSFGAGLNPKPRLLDNPVYQWVIRRDRPVRAKKIATLAYNETFISHY